MVPQSVSQLRSMHGAMYASAEAQSFWANELQEPADTYMCGFPCTAMSLAHRMPRIRNSEYPYGWGDPQALEGNRLAFLMVRRVLALAALSACVIIENPLTSYLWLLSEVLGLIGMPRRALTRVGQCIVCGAPFQKPQLWLPT